MILDFEKYAMKGNEFLNLLAKNLGDESNRDRAARILRSVFHVLRNHLTPEESMHLIAQLPMALKSLYVDGWTLRRAHEKIKTLENFADEVIREEGNLAWRDFSNVEEVMAAIQAVLETLIYYVSPQEMEQAIRTLPHALQKVLKTWMPVV